MFYSKKWGVELEYEHGVGEMLVLCGYCETELDRHEACSTYI